MTLEELAHILGEMYRNKQYTDQMTSLHMFGIIHAEELQVLEKSYRSRTAFLKELQSEAGIAKSEILEISQGIKLAEYVALK